MTRTEWADLPGAVRHAIEEHTGPVVDAATADEGVMSPFACVLHTARGPVFAKGTPLDAGQAWMYRAEAEVTRMAPLAPALLWQVEAGGWIVAGYEFIDGRHPDLSPGSGDIPALVDTLRVMSVAPWPETVRKKPLPAVSAFARALRAVWEAREAADPLPHRAPLSAAVRSWAESRMVRPQG